MMGWGWVAYIPVHKAQRAAPQHNEHGVQKFGNLGQDPEEGPEAGEGISLDGADLGVTVWGWMRGEN